MAKGLNSEQDAQRVLFSYYRGKEDQEQGKEFPQQASEYPDGVKGSLKYRAYYSAGYNGDDVDLSVYGDEQEGEPAMQETTQIRFSGQAADQLTAKGKGPVKVQVTDRVELERDGHTLKFVPVQAVYAASGTVEVYYVGGPRQRVKTQLLLFGSDDEAYNFLTAADSLI